MFLISRNTPHWRRVSLASFWKGQEIMASSGKGGQGPNTSITYLIGIHNLQHSVSCTLEFIQSEGKYDGNTAKPT